MYVCHNRFPYLSIEAAKIFRLQINKESAQALRVSEDTVGGNNLKVTFRSAPDMRWYSG